MMPSLIIDHLSIKLRSGSDNLVSEISFAIKEGESLILLGQSGSGKTMTCSAVLNLLDPKKFEVSGSVFFGETDLLNSSEKQRRGICLHPAKSNDCIGPFYAYWQTDG